MKKIYFILILVFLGFISCNQEDVLTEIPKDFQSPENSFVTNADFESALSNIYLKIRTDLYAPGASWMGPTFFGADIDLGVRQSSNITFDEYFMWNTLNADNQTIGIWWKSFYNWIYQANVIIDRAEVSTVKWNSLKEKNAIVAEAMFLRAFAYHFLGNIWGGVPIVLNETTEPKFDYVRSTQKDVYDQCKKDLEFAVQNMPSIETIKGGRASRSAAYHLLAEINICLGDYQGAINAASVVINDPQLSLMTERFGKYKDFKFNGYDYRGVYEPWGDVYFDLFADGSMNRIEGNKEVIWNVQFNPNILGGGMTNQWGGNFMLERELGNAAWELKDKNGIPNFLKDTLMGRPIGASYKPTSYLAEKIWNFKDDWGKDIRNSIFNIQREYYWTNPSSIFYGKIIKAEDTGDPSLANLKLKPYFKKVGTYVHYGIGKDGTSGQVHDQGRIFKDWYIMRLAETYLLRAEAYHLKGDNENAAKDINIVRSRAKATSVTSNEINLDLILDERARELSWEEFRLSTLTRMNKLTEYLLKYNTSVVYNKYNLDNHLNKLPIPNSEIEANDGATLEQNPGY